MRNGIVVIAAVTFALFSIGAEPAANQPATKPAGGMIGEMRIQTLPEMDYLSGSEQTTYAEIAKPYEKLIPILEKTFEEGKARMCGPFLSVFKDCKMDAPFVLEIGAIVAPGTKDVGPLKFRKTPALKCATVLYSGPMSGIGEAYGKLMGQVMAKGLQMTGEIREMFLYWEKPDSPNNVVQIQVGIK